MTTNHEWLNSVPLNNDLWLSMLVDNELTPVQRGRILQFVAETDAWQDLATKFLDDQVVADKFVRPPKNRA